MEYKNILANKPKLHKWNGNYYYGGFGDDESLERFIKYSFESDNPTILETGSGLTTLVFLSMKPQKLITISPDIEVKSRIDSNISKFNLSIDNHTYIVDYGEMALPRLLKDDPYLDFCLLDGDHGYTALFTQFYFVVRILKQNGIIAIDDIQMEAPSLMRKLLLKRNGFELIEENKKISFFRKKTDIQHIQFFW